MERVVNINRWQREHVKTQIDIRHLFSELKNRYAADPFPDYEARCQRLKQLQHALLDSQNILVKAMSEDYGQRSEFDSLIADVLPSLNHIKYSLKHLARWMKPSRRKAGLLLAPSSVRVEYQPVGVVGIMVPWNFPIYLSLAPLVTALAAGNRVMLKLSEYTPHTNQVLREILADFDEHIYVIEGDAQISAHFSQLPFDHLLFTGSTSVGRLVAKAAAQNLTPTTLELGGKSPVIIAHDADINRAIDAIMLGKTLNAGQVCVAPDYVFVPHGQEMTFVHRFRTRYRRYLASRVARQTQIINEQQWGRLQAYLHDAKQKGADVHAMGDKLSDERFMAPHLVTEVNSNMLLMQNEIFGPILPVIGYHQVSEAISAINSRPRPLALYLFSEDPIFQRQIIEQTHSGGIAINDTVMHVAAEDAPFGGIGESGMGHYHGVEGFRRLSHAKTVLTTPKWLPRSMIMLRFQSWVTKLIRWLYVR